MADERRLPLWRPVQRPGGVAAYNNVVRSVKKRDLPEKVCPVCGRPFTWRKKWARDWESVVYCSRRCRSTAKE